MNEEQRSEAKQIAEFAGAFKPIGALDTVRIACIHAESDLAGMLCLFLERPREAKMVLQNVFKPLGSIRFNIRTFSLQPSVYSLLGRPEGRLRPPPA